MLDELEELMIRADCGVPASEDIIGRVKENIKKTGDDSQPVLWAVVCAGSLLVLLTGYARRRRSIK